MKLHLKVIATASVVALLAACGGGGGASTAGPDITVPEATGTSQDTGLAPNPNGFAFPNFGAAGTPEVFGETDLVSMFGATPDICVDGGVNVVNAKGHFIESGPRGGERTAHERLARAHG
jgi:hypothetical protein